MPIGTSRKCDGIAALVPIAASFVAFAAAPAPAQIPASPPPPAPERAFFVRALAERRVTSLPPGPLYWRIETFPSAEAAAAARGPWALAASAAGRHWLFTLGRTGGATRGGVRIAEIGPVAVPPARTWLLRINHAGGPPGARTRVHSHPGSEAIYVLRGQVGQRTPHGTERAGAGETLNAHAPEMTMQLTSTGATDLDQLVMFVVDADRPFAPPASFGE